MPCVQGGACEPAGEWEGEGSGTGGEEPGPPHPELCLPDQRAAGKPADAQISFHQKIPFPLFGHEIIPATSSVPFLTSRITYAYLTYKDIREIPSLKEETVILIKAPPETTLQVPHPEEVKCSEMFLNGVLAPSPKSVCFPGAQSLQVYLHSVFGPIDALLCSDELVPVESVGAGRCSSLAAGREGSSHTPPFSQVSSESLLQVSPETTGIVTEKHLLFVSMRLSSLKSPVLQKTESAESLIIQTCSQS